MPETETETERTELVIQMQRRLRATSASVVQVERHLYTTTELLASAGQLSGAECRSMLAALDRAEGRVP